MSEWIDFKQLRESLSFKDVLDYYKVELKPKGQEQHAACMALQSECFPFKNDPA